MDTTNIYKKFAKTSFEGTQYTSLEDVYLWAETFTNTMDEIERTGTIHPSDIAILRNCMEALEDCSRLILMSGFETRFDDWFKIAEQAVEDVD